MTIVADSGALYALYDADDAHHAAVRGVVERSRPPIVVPSLLLVEVDYLLREFLGVDAELDFLRSVERGAYLVEPVTMADLERCRGLIEQYRDLDPGLADIAVVAVAERLKARGILTVDLRDFRVLASSTERSFPLLPADAAEPDS